LIYIASAAPTWCVNFARLAFKIDAPCWGCFCYSELG
jgi:hypothetical protein